MAKYRLKLFVTGDNAASRAIVAHLRALCDSIWAGQYELCIIDVLAHPEIAEDYRISVTPALIQESAYPVRRITCNPKDLAHLDTIFSSLHP